MARTSDDASKKRQYTELPDLELNPEIDERIRVMIDQADRDITTLRRHTASESEQGARSEPSGSTR